MLRVTLSYAKRSILVHNNLLDNVNEFITFHNFTIICLNNIEVALKRYFYSKFVLINKYETDNL